LFDPLERTVVVRDGSLLCGQICKKTIGAVEGGFVHLLCQDDGEDQANQFLSDLQRMVVHFMRSAGFSIGVGDCVLDAETQTEIADTVATKFGALAGCTEDEAFSRLQETANAKGQLALDHASNVAGSNQILNCINSGAKGSNLNFAQITSVVGQQAVNGKRILPEPRRTLPPCLDVSDPLNTGFVANSYMLGLTPQDVFFHQMGGREGIIDTSIKSVTWETPVILMEQGTPRYAPIGEWIDGWLDRHTDRVVRHGAAHKHLELLDLPPGTVFIPTTDERGNVSWGEMTEVTRHDPGDTLYEIKTQSGRDVVVTASKSLIVWNPAHHVFEEKACANMRVGDFLPTTWKMHDGAGIPVGIPVGIPSETPSSLSLTFENGQLCGLYLTEGGGVDSTALVSDFFVAANKHVPSFAYVANMEFTKGVLSGYFSGDGHVTKTEICAESASKELIHGIAFLCSRLGMFATLSSNVGTVNIKPSHRMAIRAQWAHIFKRTIPMLCDRKQRQLDACQPVARSHRYPEQQDVVLDAVVSIRPLKPTPFQKMYDVTVPATLNFCLASGLHVRDTANTG
jgi:hypothetical protein